MHGFDTRLLVDVGIDIRSGLIMGMTHDRLQYADIDGAINGNRRHSVPQAMQRDTRQACTIDSAIESVGQHRPRYTVEYNIAGAGMQSQGS